MENNRYLNWPAAEILNPLVICYSVCIYTLIIHVNLYQFYLIMEHVFHCCGCRIVFNLKSTLLRGSDCFSLLVL